MVVGEIGSLSAAPFYFRSLRRLLVLNATQDQNKDVHEAHRPSTKGDRGIMNRDELLRQIDAEISRLTQARNLVAGTTKTRVARSARKAGLAAPKPRAIRKKRTISPEGRARIAAAQKRRWAKQRRTKDKA